MDKLLENFLKLPSWAKLLTAFVILCATNGAWLAWGERRVVAGFSEASLAVGLYWASVIASFGLGILAGMKTSEKYNSKALGWLIGISVSMVVGVGSGLIISEIPGVGWRYDLMVSGD